MTRLRQQLSSQSGFTLPMILALAVMLAAMGIAVATVTIANIRFATHEQKSESALQVADAGINYYLWHLSHNATDYQDDTGAPASAPYGPYVHDYKNASGDKVGTYTLYITPPSSGSTVTTVKSIGQVNGLKGTRTIEAKLGIPSFANYIFLSQGQINFSTTASTTGPVHSNTGINFNGTNNGPVTAARSSYVSNVDNNTHNGVWGTGGPIAQWQYPVPSVDFTQVTADLSGLKTKAQANGVYLAGSGAQGYYLALKSDGSIDVYKVTNTSNAGITKTFIRNQAAPANGIFFASDHIWVSGNVSPGFPGRITIVSAKLPDVPSSRTNITVTDNILYAARDGASAVGLIAQNDIIVPPYAPSAMTIDAALLAQNGDLGFWGNNPTSLKTSLEIWGSQAAQAMAGFKTVDNNNNVINGFTNTFYNYDNHLLFSPPPGYPTTGSFSILNWRELLYAP
jgi:type II secretory pathway pseudopilin PulG